MHIEEALYKFMMKKYNYVFSEGSQFNQIVCAILINLPVFAYGASIGWMSPMSLLLQSEDSPRGKPLTNLEVSWLASVAYLVAIPCDFLMSILADKIGRKSSLIIMSLSCAGCWVTKLASFNIWALIFARALVGVSMAGSYVLCPLYTKEISENSIRGFLGSLVIFFHTTGNLFVFIIGDYFSYNTILWICLIVPTVHIILFIVMPDSPSYLIKNGKEEEAARVLSWLRCRREDDKFIIDEIEHIKKEFLQDEDSKNAIKGIFTDKINLRAFRIALVVSLTREVCGSIPVLNFAGSIFENATKGKLVLSANQQAMALGAVQVAGSMLGSSLMEKTGRKPLLLVTCLLSGLSMCTLATWFLLRHLHIFVPSWIPVTALCISIFCDSSGLQPVSVVITSEIFSYKYRSTVIAITVAITSVADFLQMLFFTPLAAKLGIYVAFYFFGLVCLLSSLYVLLVIPETKQKTLEKIQEKLMTKKERIIYKDMNQVDSTVL